MQFQKIVLSLQLKKLSLTNKIKIMKTTFDINILGEKYTLKTSLLGKHNIINLLLAIQMAILFNIEIPKIKVSIKMPLSTFKNYRKDELKLYLNIILVMIVIILIYI